jgi:uncharacterized protein
MSEKLPPNLMIEDNGDEPMSNHSNNPHFSSIIEKRLSRRQVLAGGLSAAVAGLFAATGAVSVAQARPGFLPPAAQGRPPFGLNPTLGFEAIPVVRSDTATIPHGYKAQVLIPWGIRSTAAHPLIRAVATAARTRNSRSARTMTACTTSRWQTIRTATASCA